MFRDLAGFFAKPYDRIIEAADKNTVGCAPLFPVRQTTLPAGSDKLHPLFISAVDSAFHGSPPRGSECSELLPSTIMVKNTTESQIPCLTSNIIVPYTVYINSVNTIYCVPTYLPSSRSHSPACIPWSRNSTVMASHRSAHIFGADDRQWQ